MKTSTSAIPTAPSLIPCLLRNDRTSEEDAGSQNVADLMDIYIEMEPEQILDNWKTESKEERKRETTKKFMIRKGRRAGLFSKLNTDHMLFITRIGRQSS